MKVMHTILMLAYTSVSIRKKVVSSTVSLDTSIHEKGIIFLYLCTTMFAHTTASDGACYS